MPLSKTSGFYLASPVLPGTLLTSLALSNTLAFLSSPTQGNSDVHLTSVHAFWNLSPTPSSPFNFDASCSKTLLSWPDLSPMPIQIPALLVTHQHEQHSATSNQALPLPPPTPPPCCQSGDHLVMGTPRPDLPHFSFFGSIFPLSSISKLSFTLWFLHSNSVSRNF